MRNLLRSMVSTTMAALVDCLHRIGNHNARYGSAGRLARGNGAIDQSAAEKRPCRVMNEDQIGSADSEGLKPSPH